MTRSVNPCNLIKEQMKDDIKYMMAVSRRTKKETAFPICELPNEKQWVPGYRRTGGKDYITAVECSELPKVDGKRLKTIGSFHTHSEPEIKGFEGVQSEADAETQRGQKAKIACIGSVKTGKLSCYRPMTDSEFKKVKDLQKCFDPQTEKQYDAYLEKLKPLVEKPRLCEIQFGKAGRLTAIKERIVKPKKPPLRF